MISGLCPFCGKASCKVIYYGFSVRLCENPDCNCMFGFWTMITNHLPFNGWMVLYKESYLSALWLFLTGR